MDINTYKEKVAQTLSELVDMGNSSTEEAAPIQGLIYRTLQSVNRVGMTAPAPDAPAAEDNLDEFNESLNHNEALEENDTPEPVVYLASSGEMPYFEAGRPVVDEGGTPVGGVGINEDGEFATIPGTQSLIDKANRLLENYDEDDWCDDECLEFGCSCDAPVNTEELTNDGFFRVRYTRLDGEPMTRSNMLDIISHPVSTSGLLRFGELRLVSLEKDEDTEASTLAVFKLENSDETHLNLNAIATNLVAYKGTLPFEGIGLVEANGSVNRR